jgi:hypothetical protein
MRRYFTLVAVLGLLSTLKPPPRIPVPMTEELWKMLTAGQPINKEGALIVYDFRTDWGAWERLLDETVAAKTVEKDEFAKSFAFTILGHPGVSYARMSVGRIPAVFIPLDSARQKIKSLLGSLDPETLANYSHPIPGRFQFPIGEPAAHSYAILVAWYFQPYSPFLRGLPIDTKQVFLPRDFPTTHPFATSFNSQVKTFIKIALKEYPPRVQVDPLYSSEQVARWSERKKEEYSGKYTVLNEAQVKYIDCLVEKASGKEMTCERP